MTTTYDAAFSAPAVQTPWDSGGHYPPSLYCISGNSYDRYSWTGTNRPWFGDAPDSPRGMLLGNKTPGGQTTNGLLGHWNPWTSVDAALCVDVNNVFLFKGNECIILPLNEAGNYKDTDPTPETHTAVTDPVPIATQFGHPYISDNTTKPPTQTTIFPLPKVDAAFLTADGTNIWFFGGNQCYLIDALTHTPEDGFHDNNGKPIAPSISSQWPALFSDFDNGVSWAAPVLDANGVIQDSAQFVTGTEWCPAIPSNRGYCPMQTFTDPSEQTFTVPDGVTQVMVQLWGPGGSGGDGDYGGHGFGGDGGAGAYLHDALTVKPGHQLAFHIGAPGDFTSCSDGGSPTLVAGGGGGGGGGAGMSNGGAGGGGAGSPGQDFATYGGGGGGGGYGPGAPGGEGGRVYVKVLNQTGSTGGDGAAAGVGSTATNGGDGAGGIGGGGGYAATGSSGAGGAGGAGGTGGTGKMIGTAGTRGANGGAGGSGGGGGGGFGIVGTDSVHRAGSGGGGGGAGGGGGGTGGGTGLAWGGGGGGGGGGGYLAGATVYGAGGGGGGGGVFGSGAAGGGGAQGPSFPADKAKQCADGDPRLPFVPLGDSGIGGRGSAYGGIGNATPGGNGAAIVTW